MKQNPRTICSVCSRNDRPKIDEAILAGTSVRAVAFAFGIGRGAVQRHAANHLSAPAVKERVARNRKRAKASQRIDAIEREIISLDNAQNVLQELQSLYAECRALLAFAQKSGDSRLAERLIGQCGVLLDKFAKTFGMFNDAQLIVNAGETRILNLVSTLSDEDLRRIVAGESLPKALSA